MIENKKISWLELVDCFKRRLGIELIVLVVVLGGGLFSFQIKNTAATAPPKYTVSSQILLTLPAAKQQVVLAQVVNPQYVASFAAALSSDLVAKPVQAKLASQGINRSLSYLEKRINVQTNMTNSLVTLTLPTNDPAQAKQIMQLDAQVASQQVKRIMGLGRGQVVAAPQVVARQAKPTYSLSKIVGLFAAAIVAALLAALLAELLDQRIRSHYFVRSTLETAPIILDPLPTLTQIAAVRNAIDIALPQAPTIVAQLPTGSSELQAMVTALATQYATSGERVLLVELNADAFWLQQLATTTTQIDYQGTMIRRFPQPATTAPVLLTLPELTASLQHLKTDFDRIILTTTGAQLTDNAQLALHLAAVRLLLLQQDVTRKKSAFQVQQAAQQLPTLALTVYLGH
ncbi:YveK family protein [Loigolactobacillus binensis]|uniref:Polysaccharide chain length determinant N-terminal domain-containing protein n=1 Tax=Loigolactobacillus binensis TaxID=2559922 RepID=A0ABW3E9L8_9LACO|nr:hypothetical protein [Loigolactobacillus binensis]